MMCRTLRKRSEWSTVPSTLHLQKTKWRETDLKTHDVALMYKASNGQPENHLLLLLSAKDLESESISTKRVERLHMQGNGKHVGVIFLLQETNDNDTRRGTIAFMNLQISIQGPNAMPIIPLHIIDALPETLMRLQYSISVSHTPVPIPHPITTLLPYCSTEYPFLEKHSKWRLTDIYKSIREVAEAATTEGGRQALRHLLSDQDDAAEKIIDFWKEEILL